MGFLASKLVKQKSEDVDDNKLQYTEFMYCQSVKLCHWITGYKLCGPNAS
jgi:hypothetical protein